MEISEAYYDKKNCFSRWVFVIDNNGLSHWSKTPIENGISSLKTEVNKISRKIVNQRREPKSFHICDINIERE